MGTKEQWSVAVVSLTLSWTPMPAVWGGGLKGGGTMSWPLPSVPVGTEAQRRFHPTWPLRGEPAALPGAWGRRLLQLAEHSLGAFTELRLLSSPSSPARKVIGR